MILFSGTVTSEGQREDQLVLGYYLNVGLSNCKWYSDAQKLRSNYLNS